MEVSTVKTARALLLVVILAALGGCLFQPPDSSGDGSSAARVTIRYQATTQIIQDEIYADPIQTAKTVSVIHQTTGTVTANASGHLYSGEGSDADTQAMVLLSSTGDAVLSLQANRDQVYGVENEWERVDNIVATDIPFVSHLGSVDTYRLEGAAACAAISVLFYSEVRSPTTAIPEAGPSYTVVDQNAQTCDETSYIEVEIEYQ
jgi:hypothetical protein